MRERDARRTPPSPSRSEPCRQWPSPRRAVGGSPGIERGQKDGGAVSEGGEGNGPCARHRGAPSTWRRGSCRSRLTNARSVSTCGRGARDGEERTERDFGVLLLDDRALVLREVHVGREGTLLFCPDDTRRGASVRARSLEARARGKRTGALGSFLARPPVAALVARGLDSLGMVDRLCERRERGQRMDSLLLLLFCERGRASARSTRRGPSRGLARARGRVGRRAGGNETRASGTGRVRGRARQGLARWGGGGARVPR